jgi:hypothetical protein
MRRTHPRSTTSAATGAPNVEVTELGSKEGSRGPWYVRWRKYNNSDRLITFESLHIGVGRTMSATLVEAGRPIWPATQSERQAGSAGDSRVTEQDVHRPKDEGALTLVFLDAQGRRQSTAVRISAARCAPA